MVSNDVSTKYGPQTNNIFTARINTESLKDKESLTDLSEIESEENIKSRPPELNSYLRYPSPKISLKQKNYLPHYFNKKYIANFN